MTIFIRLLNDKNKDDALAEGVSGEGHNVFYVDHKEFGSLPASPFAYWAGHNIRQIFNKFPPFQSEKRVSTRGASTCDDFRYVRLWTEIREYLRFGRYHWKPFTKGGKFSPFYSDIITVVDWDQERSTFRGFIGRPGRWQEKPESVDYYFLPAMTWPLRGITFSSQAVARGCIFSVGGKVAIVPEDDLLMTLSVFNSSVFDFLIRLFAGKVGGVQYESGLINQIPFPKIEGNTKDRLTSLAIRGWRAKRQYHSLSELSHAFTLPYAVKEKVYPAGCGISSVERELKGISQEINCIVFDIYGLTVQDRATIEEWGKQNPDYTLDSFHNDIDLDSIEREDDFDNDIEESEEVDVDQTKALLSWAVGVAFGRFDIRLATGERAAAPEPEPEPFDPLPAKSPGMLPDGDAPFHANTGILVDDVGHPQDLPDLIGRVLDRVGLEVAVDARAWLRREFFPMHLRQYSKSRRKAPIYWPLSTASGGYTLWLYYPALTDQTLYAAANDFVGTKLERQVEPALRALRQKTGRSRDEEDELGDLQTLYDELRDLRDELLRLAPAWKPNHDDGVQITAAPLWRLFRHRPWQTVLRDTWEKLEAGDYDWAHLAMAYWPERVREKCRTDRSLAIAHDLEHLYEPPPEAPAKAKSGGGRKKKG